MTKSLSFYELKNIAHDLGINVYGMNKYEVYDSIMNYYKIEEEYLRRKKQNPSKKCQYKRIRQIGNTGKDGTVYLTMKNNNEYAMKTFNKQTKKKNIDNEIKYQQIASNIGVAPKIIDSNSSEKYIVMEKMNSHIVDYITSKKGFLSKKYQLRLIEIFKKLDDSKIFQSDPNILNYMLKNNRLYMIDFGMCKPINKQLIAKLGTEQPNMKYTLLSFICKLKEGNCDPSSYKYLLQHLV